MESEFSPDKKIPPVPIKTYQWEDLRRARKGGGYPWTHLLKPPLEGEITAEDVLRETTPRRSMSREFSRSRTHTPVGDDPLKILNLDCSPGSSRKHGEEGEDEGVHIPNFSKEVSLDSEDDVINQTIGEYMASKQQSSQSTSHLTTPIEVPKNVSPKSILKRRVPEQHCISETREKTKCCHPLVNKIKHLTDKTLHKLERSEKEKSPLSKRKKNENSQEIRQLKSSPGAIRRQKFSAIKLGDSDEMSKTMSIDTTPPERKKKEHIYEDIEESKVQESDKNLHFSPASNEEKTDRNEFENKILSVKETDSIFEKKSIASQDPSLVADENIELKPEEHIMSKLHTLKDINNEAILLDEEMDAEEPNVDDVFQNQFDESESRIKGDSPNITITEIIDEDTVAIETTVTQIEYSPSPSPQQLLEEDRDGTDIQEVWSKNNSDHEYEIIEKPQSTNTYTLPNVGNNATMVKTEDDLSSTTSLERKYLQNASDEDDEHLVEKYNLGIGVDEGIMSAEALQKNIEDRYFVNTPSTVSRTECEVSTSQVDSSALENLPLKRDSRSKNAESIDSKIQQRLKEGTGKLKNQAGKLKTKLQSMKTKQFSMPERPKINFPDRSKFKMPERPKLSFPDRPKFTLPDRRKFSLPDRPKFKKINISEKLSLGDRKKFTMPERPKFNVPDMPKFRMPDRPKINFSSLGRSKKEPKVVPESVELNSDQKKETKEFEAKTFPRIFSRKKKVVTLASSSPTLNRADTPPPVFTFTRVKKTLKQSSLELPDSPAEPREYGPVDEDNIFENKQMERSNIDETYDFDRVDDEYTEERREQPHYHNGAALLETPSPEQEYTHVINEINNDEFFVRPRGISRENIQVREYLSDEIRQAFQIPKNTLALMGSTSRDNDEHMYGNEEEADPELLLDENEPMRYSNEDINDRDDGYYTFPPVRPSRAKRKKKVLDSVQYIDDSTTASMQFSDVDLGLSQDNFREDIVGGDVSAEHIHNQQNIQMTNLQAKLQNEYENDELVDFDEIIPIQSQTLPMPPKRKKKSFAEDYRRSSLSDFQNMAPTEIWKETCEPTEDIIVYRTEHEYIVPQTDTMMTDPSPIPPNRSRNRSRSSRGTSLCDDDRTSQGADSLTLDTHGPHVEDVEIQRVIRHESPGYATVDKGPYAPSKSVRRSKSKTPPVRSRSKSKTPPVRRRKSDGSDRKYYTVGPSKPPMPDRPPRKKSSTSLMTLNSLNKQSTGDISQYVEIDEPRMEEIHKLVSGEVISKMKDRPLPPPPRPPRGSRSKRKDNRDKEKIKTESQLTLDADDLHQQPATEDVVEVEMSTQTDPLPDDVDYELGMDDNLDISMSSSLRDIVDEEHMISKSLSKLIESPRVSRPTSRSEKSYKLSDPKISELSKSSLGRTSPTVILVERRVSSPTRINERDEILTEASLTVQHIDIDEAKIPDVPPLPTPRNFPTLSQSSNIVAPTEERALERISNASREIQLDNLVTKRLQVKDLDVGRLNVSELQASKILVSDIEGMTLQVSELDSKSGHISVSGIEFSQSVIDEIVKKFAELSTPASTSLNRPQETEAEHPRAVSREEETQTEEAECKDGQCETVTPPPTIPIAQEDSAPPQRPPPPDLTPLLYSYLHDLSTPPGSFYHVRTPRDRPFTEFHESQHQTPPPPTRRVKRKPATHHSESSSEESRPRPSPRRMPAVAKSHEPSISEAGAQFFRVCQSSISRTMRNIFNHFMTYISGTEDKRDVQMALVIFLVLIAGLIMFGLSDSRTVHHHHWEFFNPPDGKQ